MKFLGRLTLLDVGLIVALVVTGVLWAISSGSDNRGSFDDVDQVAWERAVSAVADAFASTNLATSRAALLAAADVAAPANDAGAEGIRAFAIALTDTGVAAIETALSAVDTSALNSQFFAGAFQTAWLAAHIPRFPIGRPDVGTEWAQANLSSPNDPLAQFWGSTVWSLPVDMTESIGEADVALEGIDFSAKLMIAVNGGEVEISLVYVGALAEPGVLDFGFWVIGQEEVNELDGPVVARDPGVISRAIESDGLGLIARADELVAAFILADNRQLELRVQVGETGRAVLERGTVRAP